MGGLLMMGGMALAVCNTLVLAALGVVWLGNYRQFRSSMLLGLVGFSALLLVENLVAVSFFFTGMGTVYAPAPLVERAVVTMRSLQFLAVVLLGYATLR